MDDLTTDPEAVLAGESPSVPETDGGPAAERPDRRRGPARSILPVALAAGALLVLAFPVRTSGPRQLPFPRLDARDLFPQELAARQVEDERAPAAPTSQFDATLQAAGAPLPAPAAAPFAEPPEPRLVPLGGDLVGEIPDDRDVWLWSTEDGATLVLHQTSTGRPDALVYTEAFTPLIERRPTAEIHRFHTSVAPLVEADTPFLGRFRGSLDEVTAARSAGRGGDLAARARITQLLASRTRGRGLGFDARDDRFTGWRWVGRNEHGVALRLGRWEGAWHRQRELPAQPAAAVANAPEAPPLTPPPPPLERLQAHLLEGSAAEPGEVSGAHLAILCARPRACPVAEELAAFIASIRTDPGRADGLRKEGVAQSLQELAALAGLEIRKPAVRDGGEGD